MWNPFNRGGNNTTPAASGGIETGIPAGAPPNPNTLGGLMPMVPEIKPLTGLEPFGEPAMSSVQATQSTMAAEKEAATQKQTDLSSERAEREAAAVSSSGISPLPGVSENLDLVNGTTAPLSTYGAASPAAVEGPSAPKFDGSATAPDAPTPPRFSMDAITTPKIETSEPVADSEPTQAVVAEDAAAEPEEDAPAEPEAAEPTTPEPAPVVDISPIVPETPEQVAEVTPTEPAVAGPTEEAKTDGNDGLKPLDDAGAEQPAVPEPTQAVIAEAPESAPIAEAPIESSEEKPDNIVPFPAPVAPPAEAPAAAQTDLPLAA